MKKQIITTLLCLSLPFLMKAPQAKPSLEQQVVGAIIQATNGSNAVRRVSSVLQETEETINPNAPVTMTFEQFKILLGKDLPPGSFNTLISMIDERTEEL